MTNWTIKPGLQYEDASVILIGGQQRFVPLLAMRQNRVIVPLMLEVLPIIEAAGGRQVEVVGDDGVARVETVPPLPEVAMRLFEAGTIDIMNRIVYAALTRAYSLTYEEYLDEPASVHELTGAMPAIVKQTAFFKATTGQPRAGEAPAAR